MLRRAAALATAPTLQAADLFPDSPAQADIAVRDQPMSLSDHVDIAERAYLVATLHELGGAVGEAAHRLGISRKTLWEKMKRHGIDRQQLQTDSERQV